VTVLGVADALGGAVGRLLSRPSIIAGSRRRASLWRVDASRDGDRGISESRHGKEIAIASSATTQWLNMRAAIKQRRGGRSYATCNCGDDVDEMDASGLGRM
jgi:hypothetical protein